MKRDWSDGKRGGSLVYLATRAEPDTDMRTADLEEFEERQLTMVRLLV